MDAPAVAVTRDGKKVAAAWMDTRLGGNNRQIYWTMTGRPEAALADDPKGVKGHPSIAFDDRGRLHAAWEDFRSGVLRIHYRGAGKDVALSPGKGNASFPSLACGNKTVGVAFEHDGRAAFVAPVTE
jgi:hypothetical protein